MKDKILLEKDKIKNNNLINNQINIMKDKILLEKDKIKNFYEEKIKYLKIHNNEILNKFIIQMQKYIENEIELINL
jgi:hypothetical protein